MKSFIIVVILILAIDQSSSQTVKILLEERKVISNQDTSLVTCIGHGTCPCLPKHVESWNDGKYMILAGKDWKTGLVTTFQIKNGNYCGEVNYYWNVKRKYKFLFFKKYYLLEISNTEYYDNCDSLAENKKAELSKIEGKKTIRIVLK